MRARAPCVFSSQIERAHCKPWGLEGGGEATGNSIGLRVDGKWKDDFPNAKMVMANLKVGDAYVLRSGGGGGYGPAWERPADRVAEDVRQGYVSPEAAAEAVRRGRRYENVQGGCRGNRQTAGGAEESWRCRG